MLPARRQVWRRLLGQVLWRPAAPRRLDVCAPSYPPEPRNFPAVLAIRARRRR